MTEYNGNDYGRVRIAIFYAVTQWRNLYGIKGLYYPVSHHGHDIACAGRQKVPCYRGGTVQPWKHSSVVGQTIAIRHGLGDYSGYCHLINRISRAGTVIAAGAFVGEAATWGDFTGSAWSGPHVHTVVGNSAACVFGIGTRDPAPYIRAALTASSTAKLTITPMEEDELSQAQIDTLKAELTQEIRQLRPVQLYTYVTGIIAVGPGGSEWIVPSQAYVALLDHLGLAAPQSVVISTEMLGFLKTISGQLNPDPVVTKQVDAVLTLSADSVAALAAQIPERSITLSAAQLDAIVAAAKDGAAEGVKSLAFVTVAQ